MKYSSEELRAMAQHVLSLSPDDMRVLILVSLLGVMFNLTHGEVLGRLQALAADPASGGMAAA